MDQELLPDERMIVFGRGKACNGHPGNMKMRSILNNYKDQYRSASKGEKGKLVRQIYGEIAGEGMKFVKPSEQGDGWVEVDALTAIDKLRHSLRNPKVGRNLKGTARSQATTLHGGSSYPAAGSSAGKLPKEPTCLKQLTGTSQSSVSGTLCSASLQPRVQTSAAQSFGSALPLTGRSNHPGSFVPASIAEPLQSTWPSTSGLQFNAGTNLEQMNAALYQISGIPVSAGLAQNGLILGSNNTSRNGENDVTARSPNQLIQMEVEWLRSNLAIPVASLATLGQIPLPAASQSSSAAARDDLLLSLASSNSQLNSVPDDPMFWIRKAVVSLFGTDCSVLSTSTRTKLETLMTKTKS